ncbi:MAG: type II secretion system minor pseudopilin GspJ [Haliea sp.]|nr:type II secretion system minor pseudopilin GspJ [Haliea sp.]
MKTPAELPVDVARAKRKSTAGFTLIEVLIALAITAFVSVIAYTSLSAVMSGVESLRTNTDRIYEVNRALMILSRDLRQFANRPVRDEFGELEPAMTGGALARFTLSFTRTGWHNPSGYPRSNLQRVNYRLEEGALWRDSYTVLDRAADSEPQSVLLLDQVDELRLTFLPTLEDLQVEMGGTTLDTTNWVENWVADSATPGAELAPPIAIEITLELPDGGEMRRLYALPPL